ncbi:lytic transglycosylase domain-containing protein [Luteimonas sp. 3794]|uniref:lytic transglycosylase domain-containing protein n=1 Tax=Luteimonas sp. 3794 TaxID=2817730 RepID=UPI00285FDCDF|nr:lytic transglycosylase domain-containing protein [Luteimonas sp. 3794]MDR6991642.1 type IV secretion system protein VirB1 [Luteimonas sp. 3794]
MLPGLELMGCSGLAVPAEVMHHVVRVESSYNPYAIGVVGGRLARQPRSLEEALSTSRMLEREGYNFSLGLAQVNRHNLQHYGLDTHEKAFDICPNLRAGAQILAECHTRAGGDWGKAFSCYYSGNFVTGYQHGYVQKVLASWRAVAPAQSIPVIRNATAAAPRGQDLAAESSRVASRVQEAARGNRPAATELGLDASRAAAEAPAVEAEIRRMSAIPPAASLHSASGPAQRQADADAPVTVQLTSAPLRQTAPPASPSAQSASAGQAGDTAFVF